MLSSSSNNGDEHFIVHHHHLTLLTQPVLAVRSRPKKIPVESNQTERKGNGISFPQSDSSDSGIDLCLSSSSSIQYGPQYSILHRPLSALNEDSLTPDQHEFSLGEPLSTQTKRTKFTRMNSIEDLVSSRKHRSSSFASEPTQLDHLLSSINVTKRSANLPLKTKKPNEYSTASSSTETTPRSKLPNVQRAKPKAITPLGHYPNPEQIRAHINRSVIDTQHPPPFSLSKRKGILQQLIPFDASPAKVNNRYVRHHIENHYPTTQFHPDPTMINTNANVAMFHQEIKRKKGSIPSTTNRTKISPNDRSSQQENHRTIRKQIDESDLSEEEEKAKKILFTNVPRRHQRTNNESNESKTLHRPNQQHFVSSVIPFHRTSRLPHLNDETKSTTNRLKQKTRVMESNSSAETNANVLLPNRPALRLIENSIRRPTHVPMKQRPKDTNPYLNVSKVGQNRLVQANPSKHNSNRKSRESSPTSWSVISQHQSNQQRIDIHDSSTSSSYISFTFESGRTSAKTLIDGRYVRLEENPRKSSFVDSPSQTSSHHTYPFTCTAEFDTLIENSLNEQEKNEKKDSMTENQHLLSGKLTISMQADDVSTNYDSDDGWSNESAEILYTDEEHFASKKKHRVTSSQLKFKITGQN